MSSDGWMMLGHDWHQGHFGHGHDRRVLCPTWSTVSSKCRCGGQGKNVCAAEVLANRYIACRCWGYHSWEDNPFSESDFACVCI